MTQMTQMTHTTHTYLIEVAAKDGSALVGFRVNAVSFTEATIKALDVLEHAAEPDRGRIAKIIRDHDGRELVM